VAAVQIKWQPGGGIPGQEKQERTGRRETPRLRRKAFKKSREDHENTKKSSTQRNEIDPLKSQRWTAEFRKGNKPLHRKERKKKIVSGGSSRRGKFKPRRN